MNREQVKDFLNDVVASDVVIHISHNDLDGYGSTYVVEKYLKDRCMLIQDNTNYGEIIDKINELNISKSTKVIITDLNLSIVECEYLDNVCDNWMVVDHHITGQSSFIQYPSNYFLNITKCATQLIFECLSISNHLIDNTTHVKDLVNVVNTYDMWKKEDSSNFKKGMLLSYYVFNNPFEDKQLKHQYNTWMFDKIGNFLLEYGVQETELQYQRMYRFWMQNLENEDFLRDNELPSNIKVALLHTNIIKKYMVDSTDEYIIYSGISSKVTQYVFDRLLQQEEFKNKVLINMSVKENRVNCSFRDIIGNSSKFATRAGGGGHKFASGASFKLDINENALDKLLELISD